METRLALNPIPVSAPECWDDAQNLYPYQFHVTHNLKCTVLSLYWNLDFVSWCVVLCKGTLNSKGWSRVLPIRQHRLQSVAILLCEGRESTV